MFLKNHPKRWEKEMQNAYLNARAQKSTDLMGLYIKLEQISKKYMEKGEMYPGDETFFPTIDGMRYNFTFHKNSTSVEMENAALGTGREVLLSKEASYRREYKELQTISSYMKLNQVHIGEMYPEELRKVLRDLSSGDLISFVDGRSYVCIDNKDLIVSLAEAMHNKPENFRLTSLQHLKKVVIDTTQNRDIQAFYDDNSKYTSERLEYSYTNSKAASKLVKRIEDTIGRNQSREFVAGNITLYAQDSRKHDRVVWYDAKGNNVDRKTVCLIFGLLQNHLRERKYEYKNPSDKLVEAQLIERNIEVYSVTQSYAKMFDELMNAAKNEEGSLSIKFKYFGNQPGTFNYVPEMITFINDNGVPRCCISTFVDNDFTNDVASTREITAKEFIAKCQEVYSESCRIIRTRTEEQILSQYQNLKNTISKTQQSIVSDIQDRALNKEGDLLKKEYVPTDKDVEAFLLRYLSKDHKTELSAENIKDVVNKKGGIIIDDYEIE